MHDGYQTLEHECEKQKHKNRWIIVLRGDVTVTGFCGWHSSRILCFGFRQHHPSLSHGAFSHFQVGFQSRVQKKCERFLAEATCSPAHDYGNCCIRLEECHI